MLKHGPSGIELGESLGPAFGKDLAGVEQDDLSSEWLRVLQVLRGYIGDCDDGSLYASGWSRRRPAERSHIQGARERRDQGSTGAAALPSGRNGEWFQPHVLNPIAAQFGRCPFCGTLVG